MLTFIDKVTLKRFSTIIGLVMVTGTLLYGQSSFYKLSARDIDGNVFKFSQLKGKKVMIVNTASKCGFTPQYADLEKLYEKYRKDGFVIIGFPSNDFNHQEPGSNSEIKQFCKKNYGVSFPMMSKISVKGEGMDPVYQWLTSKENNGKIDSKVKWNFQKYLISRNGELIQVIYSREKPDADEIVAWIEK